MKKLAAALAAALIAVSFSVSVAAAPEEESEETASSILSSDAEESTDTVTSELSQELEIIETNSTPEQSSGKENSDEIIIKAAPMNSYSVDKIGMSMELPSNMYVLSLGMDENDPALKACKTTKAEMEKSFKESNTYIKASAKDFSYDITVTLVQSDSTKTIGNLTQLSDDNLQKVVDDLLEQKIYTGCAKNKYNDTLFLSLEMAYENGDTKVYGIQNYTIVNDTKVVITFQSYNHDIAQAHRNFLKEIMDSVYFKNSSGVLPVSNPSEEPVQNLDPRYFCIMAASVIGLAALAGMIISASKYKLAKQKLEQQAQKEEQPKKKEETSEITPEKPEKKLENIYDSSYFKPIDEDVIYEDKTLREQRELREKNRVIPRLDTTTEVEIPNNPYTPVGKAEAVIQPPLSLTSEFTKLTLHPADPLPQTADENGIVFAESLPKPKTDIEQLSESILENSENNEEEEPIPEETLLSNNVPPENSVIKNTLTFENIQNEEKATATSVPQEFPKVSLEKPTKTVTIEKESSPEEVSLPAPEQTPSKKQTLFEKFKEKIFAYDEEDIDLEDDEDTISPQTNSEDDSNLWNRFKNSMRNPEIAPKPQKNLPPAPPEVDFEKLDTSSEADIPDEPEKNTAENLRNEPEQTAESETVTSPAVLPHIMKRAENQESVSKYEKLFGHKSTAPVSLEKENIKTEPELSKFEKKFGRMTPVSPMVTLDKTEEKQPEETPVEESKPNETPVEESKSEETPIEESEPDESSVEESKPDETPVEESKSEETPVEESKSEETPVEESKSEETPVEESKPDETLVEESKPDETLVEESKSEETPVEESKSEETPVEESKSEETPIEESEPDETPVEESKSEETPIEESKSEETPIEESKSDETPVEESEPDETPVEESKSEETPVEESKPDETPVEESKSKETPVEESKTNEISQTEVKSKNHDCQKTDQKQSEMKAENMENENNNGFVFERDSNIKFEHAAQAESPIQGSVTPLTSIPKLESVNADEYNSMIDEVIQAQKKEKNHGAKVRMKAQRPTPSPVPQPTAVKPSPAETSAASASAPTEEDSTIEYYTGYESVDDPFQNEKYQTEEMIIKNQKKPNTESFGTKLKNSFARLFSSDEDHK